MRCCRKKTGCGGSVRRSVRKLPAKDDVPRSRRHSHRPATLGPRRMRRVTGRRPYSDRLRLSAILRPVVASPTPTSTSQYLYIHQRQGCTQGRCQKFVFFLGGGIKLQCSCSIAVLTFYPIKSLLGHFFFFGGGYIYIPIYPRRYAPGCTGRERRPHYFTN